MNQKDSRPITELLRAWNNGDAAAWDELANYVHEPLVRIAKNRLRAERRKNHTLEAEDLVGELFRRLMKEKKAELNDREHFYRLCTTKMSYILTDWARKRKIRIGNSGNIAPEEEAHEIETSGSERLLQINEAFTLLRQEDQRAADVLEMRYWLGLKNTQIAEIIQRSTKIVETDLKNAEKFIDQYFRNNGSHERRRRSKGN